MKISLEVELRFSPSLKRWGLRTGMACLTLGSASIALADSPPKVWQDGEVLTAQDLNDRFVQLEAQVIALSTELALLQDGVNTSAVPHSAVIAFNLDSCPTGWMRIAEAAGRTIVGVNLSGTNEFTARALGDSFGEERHTLTVAEMPSHSHSLTLNGSGSGPNEGVWNLDWSLAGATGSQIDSPGTLRSWLPKFHDNRGYWRRECIQQPSAIPRLTLLPEDIALSAHCAPPQRVRAVQQ